MQLKNSGMILEKRVKTVKFQGFNCLALVFKNDTSKVQNIYFKDATQIIFYISPQDYTMKGYKLTGSYDFYAVCSGFLRINGIIMPKCKTYFSNTDNSFKWVDIFTPVE